MLVSRERDEFKRARRRAGNTSVMERGRGGVGEEALRVTPKSLAT